MLAANPVPGAATPSLRQRLITSPGAGTVLHSGAQAIYALFPGAVGGVVGVVTRGAVQVPAAIAVALDELPEVAVGAPARVDGSMLYVAGLAVSVVRMTRADVPRIPAGCWSRLAAVLPDLDVVRRQLPAGSLDALARGEATSVAPLVGRGDGLTPVGDDVVSGWLVAARALGRDISAVRAATRAAAGRTTALSAALLDHAADGEAIPQLRAVLLALAAGVGQSDPAAAVERLAAVGHTSGRGLLLGAWLAIAPTGADATPQACPVAQEGTPR